MLWTKQFYHYGVQQRLDGDPEQPTPPEGRLQGRNSDWKHLYGLDVLSMPDKWEYPWFAAWDLAFHAIPIAMIDPEWAKRQIILLLREWYMHPNGQLPAYEWPSATSTHPFTVGPRGRCTRSPATSRARPTQPSWSRSSTSCC
ncbi:MAG TPA: hypothetical protein VM537_29455 [Anaerolineae bacterium]|nr:hypothetical protein [Anaerolineae bacterium]